LKVVKSAGCIPATVRRSVTTESGTTVMVEGQERTQVEKLAHHLANAVEAALSAAAG